MRGNLGFTLVELLIAVAVVAVLVGVGLPAYTGAVQKHRRGDAIAALQKLEFAQNGHYANHLAYAVSPAALRLPAVSEDGHYDIVVERADAGGYDASARARADSPQRHDAACATLTLVQQGERVTRGPSPACWNP